jgi:hypothetical protein
MDGENERFSGYLTGKLGLGLIIKPLLLGAAFIFRIIIYTIHPIFIFQVPFSSIILL